jgi:hypothetical protein
MACCEASLWAARWQQLYSLPNPVGMLLLHLCGEHYVATAAFLRLSCPTVRPHVVPLYC